MTRRSLRTNGKRPDMVKVGAIHYKVSYVPDLKDDGRPLDGQVDHGLAEISIKANLGEQIQVQTILHEVIHAIETQTGRHHELKESMIDALAFGIYQVMRENPQLVKMITK
jgi:hypothetical protein